MAEQTETRSKKVQYGLKVYESLPEGRDSSRGSELSAELDEIKGNPELYGQVVSLGEYGNPTAASAAANVLRQKHGRSAKVDGWIFATRVVNNNGEKATALFAIYDPAAVVEGEREKHEAAEKARRERLAAKREEKRAQESPSDVAKVERAKAAGDRPAQGKGSRGAAS